MPVGVPPRAQVAQEPLPVARAHRLPQLAGDGPDLVDHRVPAAATGGLPGRVAAQGAGQLVQPGREGVGFRHRRRGRCGGVAVRQQPAPRQRGDRAAMALVEQGDHAVDGGQAGADQQHRRVRIEPLQRVGRPRVGLCRRGCRRMTGPPPAAGRAGSCRSPARRRSARTMRLRSRASASPAPSGVIESTSPRISTSWVAPAGHLHLPVQQVAHVAAEHAPRHERGGPGLHPARFFRRQALQPVQEVERPLGKRAHPGSRHVQQVAGVAVGVGGPAAEPDPARSAPPRVWGGERCSRCSASRVPLKPAPTMAMLARSVGSG